MWIMANWGVVSEDLIIVNYYYKIEYIYKEAKSLIEKIKHFITRKTGTKIQELIDSIQKRNKLDSDYKKDWQYNRKETVLKLQENNGKTYKNGKKQIFYKNWN